MKHLKYLIESIEENELLDELLEIQNIFKDIASEYGMLEISNLNNDGLQNYITYNWLSQGSIPNHLRGRRFNYVRIMASKDKVITIDDFLEDIYNVFVPQVEKMDYTVKIHRLRNNSYILIR